MGLLTNYYKLKVIAKQKKLVMRKLVIFLFFLSACTGDVIPPNEPPFPMVVGVRWNLKSSVTGGVTQAGRGEWFKLTNVDKDTTFCSIWRDNVGNEWPTMVTGYSITVVSPHKEYSIKYLSLDSLVLENCGTTFHYKK
jgi:hypothetical protein